MTFTEPGPVSAVAFSPDGRLLAAALASHQVHVYPLQPQDVVALASTHLTRTLTTEECQTYLHQACPTT